MAKMTRVYSRRAVDAAQLLGLQVKQGRIQRGWTQRELAERAGITPPTLAKVEHGDPTVGLGVAFDVALIVGVPLFFEESGRLTSELARQAELVRLLPARVSGDTEEVDDDF